MLFEKEQYGDYIDEELSQLMISNLYEMDYREVANYYAKKEKFRKAACSTLRAVVKRGRRISFNNAEPMAVLVRIAKQRAESVQFIKNQDSKQLKLYSERIEGDLKKRSEKIIKELS